MSRLVTEIVGNESYEYYPLGNHIVRAVGVCGGRPTFKYTRIEITGTLERLATGENLNDVVKGYRGRVSRDAIMEAAMLITDEQNMNDRLKQWGTWLSESQQWSATMLAKRDGQLFDTEALWQDIRAELEARHDEVLCD